MAITEKDSKWEWRNSWFCLLFILFPVNFIPFFMMYARVQKQQYLIKGSLSAIFLVAFIVSVTGIFGFTATEIVFVVALIYHIVTSILGALLDRPSFLRALEEKENQSSIRSFMTGSAEKAASRVSAPEAATAVDSSVTKTSVSSSSGDRKIDINTATEQELSEITILNVVDIKRIMQYRGEHGGFSTKDEFYSSFGAKPHIIAKLDGIIVVNKNDDTHTHGNAHPSRRFDL